MPVHSFFVHRQDHFNILRKSFMQARNRRRRDLPDDSVSPFLGDELSVHHNSYFGSSWGGRSGGSGSDCSNTTDGRVFERRFSGGSGSGPFGTASGIGDGWTEHGPSGRAPAVVKQSSWAGGAASSAVLGSTVMGAPSSEAGVSRLFSLQHQQHGYDDGWIGGETLDGTRTVSALGGESGGVADRAVVSPATAPAPAAALALGSAPDEGGHDYGRPPSGAGDENRGRHHQQQVFSMSPPAPPRVEAEAARRRGLDATDGVGGVRNAKSTSALNKLTHEQDRGQAVGARNGGGGCCRVCVGWSRNRRAREVIAGIIIIMFFAVFSMPCLCRIQGDDDHCAFSRLTNQSGTDQLIKWVRQAQILIVSRPGPVVYGFGGCIIVYPPPPRRSCR